VAATLDLPINQNLGFAYIIPYGTEATFQLGYKGFIQLAQRTGLYKTINAAEVYEGEIKYRNRITGEIEFDFEGKTSDKIIGYVSYFKLINGFERFLYMTVDDVKKHAKKFSKTYGRNGSIWTTEFDAMALKTVTKLNLSKYGVLSIEMQKALETDSAVINGVEDEPNVSFVDNPEYTIQPDDVIITPTGETTVTNTEDVKPEQENMFKGSPLE
jgi:recombination protein RecT